MKMKSKEDWQVKYGGKFKKNNQWIQICPAIQINNGGTKMFLNLFNVPIKMKYVCSVMKFGSRCEYKEYKDMLHGWIVRGDMR